MNTYWLTSLCACLDIMLIGAVIVLSAQLGKIKIDLDAIKSKIDKKLM